MSIRGWVPGANPDLRAMRLTSLAEAASISRALTYVRIWFACSRFGARSNVSTRFS